MNVLKDSMKYYHIHSIGELVETSVASSIIFHSFFYLYFFILPSLTAQFMPLNDAIEWKLLEDE
jgi:hypothetical protein